MSTKKAAAAVNYIPAREYLPGPEKKYQSVFVESVGQNGEMFYLRLDDAEKLTTGQVPHFLHVYRQTKVIKRSDGQPGIIGVHAEEATSLEEIIPKITEELRMRSFGGTR